MTDALGRRGLLAHVVAWAADGAVAAYVRRRWPAVRVVDVSAALAEGDAMRDAPFESSAYARFAAVKALMPHAAAALRAPALTQDADVVRGPGPPKRDSGYRRERRTRRGTGNFRSRFG